MIPWPKPDTGFDLNLIEWGAPDERVASDCSYCRVPFAEQDVPLRLWTHWGWAAAFCSPCQRRYWGLQALAEDESDGTDDEHGAAP